MAAKEAELLGIGQMRQNFDRLKEGMIRKTSLRMVAAAGGVLRKEARREAAAQGLRQSGALIRNIAIKRERRAPFGVARYHLGVRHGRELTRKARKNVYMKLSKSGSRVVTRYQNDPFYWRFLELGTKHIRPREFLQKALQAKRTEALAAMEARLQTDLRKFDL